MAVSQASLELRNDTDANFRLWGNFISAGLLAGGWTKMDTDINWTTVNSPAQNAWAGYEVWRSPAETGLSLFYVKLRYGSHNHATKGPALEYTLGWGYSGSGSNLSGVVQTARSSQANNVAAASNVRLCSIAAGVGYVVINLGNSSAAIQHGHTLAISRDRNSALEKIDRISSYFSFYNASVIDYRMSCLDTWGEYPSVTSNSIIASQLSSGNTIQFGNVGLAYLQGVRGFKVSPLETLLGVYTINAVNISLLGTAGQTVTIPVYGVNKTFLIGESSSATTAHFAAIANIHPLYLYE